MEELFNARLPGGERPDIQLCIFPHLKEFLVLDLREGQPQVTLLHASEVFQEEFFRSVEAELSQAVREGSDFPFAHLIEMPVRLDEVIRNTAMTFILNRLGIHLHEEDQFPTVIVFIVSGGALASQSDRVLEGLRNLLKEHSGDSTAAEWEGTISRMMADENAILQDLSRQGLHEAMSGDSPDYFTLWENRN